MEFLVNVEVIWPPDGDEEKRSQLVAAEKIRASELSADGTIKRLWRIPGRWANWGVWAAEDATSLHEALASLPLFPWMSIEVHPLAAHPSDPVAQ